jgi:hypothetical protein
MIILDQDFFPSRILNPTNKEGAINFTNLKNIFFLAGTEKDLSRLTQSLSIFNPKYCHLTLRNMGWTRQYCGAETICSGSGSDFQKVSGASPGSDFSFVGTCFHSF